MRPSLCDQRLGYVVTAWAGYEALTPLLSQDEQQHGDRLDVNIRGQISRWPVLGRISTN